METPVLLSSCFGLNFKPTSPLLAQPSNSERLDEISDRIVAETEKPYEEISSAYIAGQNLIASEGEGGITSEHAEYVKHMVKDALDKVQEGHQRAKDLQKEVDDLRGDGDIKEVIDDLVDRQEQNMETLTECLTQVQNFIIQYFG
jgi:gas vesicle protein